VRCGLAAGGAACIASCVTSAGNPAAYLAVALDAAAACYRSVACTAPPSTCSEQSLIAVDPQWQQEALFTTCTAKAAQCNAAGASQFSNDNCVYAVITIEATQAALATCFAGDCAAFASCFRAALGMPTR